MDVFLGYFAAVSVSCGSYFVTRVCLTCVLLSLSPLLRSGPVWLKRLYIVIIPSLLTITTVACLLILSVEIFDLLSRDDRIYDPLTYVCYLLIAIFTFLLEGLLQFVVKRISYVKKFLEVPEEERGLIN